MNWSTLPALGIATWAATASAAPPPPVRFEVTFPAAVRASAVDGRVYVLLSRDATKEPRFQIFEGIDSQQIFGVDVLGLAPGQAAVIGANTLGYPAKSLADIPPGEYQVQAVLNVYETFRRSDGHTVLLPPDKGEGQHWESKPGNLISRPQKLRIGTGTVRIALSEAIPPVASPVETKYLRHVTVRSRLLSDFWGRDMELGAWVLLPPGFDEHPDARYPLAIYHGHFTSDWRAGSAFREEPPAPGLTGSDRTDAEYSYRLYQDWTAGRLPKMLIMTVQHANPYYDDSYAVNSANLGPYGDAIVKELIPEVERRFRGIGAPWSRVMYGGSTGGWEVLGAQVFYPDEFAGVWCFCPDPVDFRAYELVNIYEDENAYGKPGPFAVTPRPAKRDPDGHVTATVEQSVRFEAVLGSRGRSSDQWDIWQAVFGPVGEDGYPQAIWDKATGIIDKKVAAYWRDHYDLRHILERDWKTLGPKLAGKIRIKVGTLDTYYLEKAVRYLEAFLERTTDPYWRGSIEYGHDLPHCYSGDPSVPVSISSRTMNQRLLPEMAEHMLRVAPPGADVSSWRY
ncbi:MAG TPA: hypothetical protein VMV21_07845 [Vicinamibacteria bacterium]|nr:hypothetical protein [Vicinamibacteria bacterium]